MVAKAELWLGFGADVENQKIYTLGIAHTEKEINKIATRAMQKKNCNGPVFVCNGLIPSWGSGFHRWLLDCGLSENDSRRILQNTIQILKDEL